MMKLFLAPVKLRHFFKFCKSVFKLQTKLHFINQPIKHYSLLPRVDYTCDQDVSRSNRIISKLSKEGQVDEARKLFDKMSEPDVVSWTAMISGYIRCGKIDKARELFDRTNAKRDVVTWTAMLAAYARTNRILEAEMLFNEMPEKNVVSWNSLIDGYARNGRIDKGLELFWKMRERNVVSWNMVIAGLARNGRINEARVLFDQMPEKNVVSWTTMIAGLSRNGRVDEARTLFYRTPERNVVSWNAMITGYTQNSRLDEAFELFEMMPEKIVSSWNTMIMGFIQNGELSRARILFDKMRQRDVVSWSTMINGYMQEGRSEEALRNFYDMQMDVLVKPNEGTFVSVLGACSDLAGLSEGMQIHQVINKTIYQKNEIVISALINMYSKCGDVATARKIFDDGLRGQRDLISWNVMIAAYTHHGFGRDAINLFKEMLQLGFKPNDVTYVGLLAACSHSGLVEEGLKYFDELCRDDSIKLREDHYTCLVDICGRAGRLKDALVIIERLPRTESAFIWGALLSGCNLHGDSETGKLAAIKLLGIQAKSSGTYLSLSKLCASNGKWKEAAKLRTQMKDRGLKKQPGCSWIAVENRVHMILQRVVMPPMTRNRSYNNTPQPHAIEYYAQRATNGGFLISESTSASDISNGSPNMPGIWTEDQAEAWKPIVDSVHGKAWNAVPDDGEYFRPTPKQLKANELPLIVNDFRNAAHNAIEAGFDGVEINAANSYIIDQFLNDQINDRTDAYGGNIENRCRLALEIIGAVVEEIGADRVGVKLSLFSKVNTFEGTLTASGGYNKTEGDEAITESYADLVSFGRLFLANPDLPKRFEVNAPLNKHDRSTFYRSDPVLGYTDYPSLEIAG
ncbi:hypothetical protein RDI58_010385 [Solanum bulbocastanum]|uniref:NADH:flavin oxidoreductase/NADH oxidase N-terminal domain-containing protein n=2 Tax=Solanum TaxID=4107 RepID=A0AAN8YFD3_SOLBU